MKSQTIREIGPASTSAILPPPNPRPSCPPHAENGSALASESRVTNHASLISPSSNQNPESTIQHPPASPRKLSRNGKIARLAKPLRDMVNLMLQNNIPHAEIVDALAEHGVRATKRNVSNWKTRGGYNDWRLEQERIISKRLRQDNLTDYVRTTHATHLPEVGLQLTATQLCEFLLKPETEQQLASNPEKFARTISNLCRVTRHLHLLQKYRDDSARELGYKHNPERLKRDLDKRLETTRHIYSAEKLSETDDEPDTPHRNFIPKNHFADDSSEDSPRPPVDPPSLLSALTSALKNGLPSNPATGASNSSPSISLDK